MLLMSDVVVNVVCRLFIFNTEGMVKLYCRNALVLQDGDGNCRRQNGARMMLLHCSCLNSRVADRPKQRRNTETSGSNYSISHAVA